MEDRSLPSRFNAATINPPRSAHTNQEDPKPAQGPPWYAEGTPSPDKRVEPRDFLNHDDPHLDPLIAQRTPIRITGSRHNREETGGWRFPVPPTSISRRTTIEWNWVDADGNEAGACRVFLATRCGRRPIGPSSRLQASDS